MSINIETGLWRCFKTGEVGNFLKLYAILEKCSYREAYEKFVFEDFMAGYKGRRPIEEFDPNQIDSDLDEVENFKIVEDHPFVESRGVGQFKFYVATSGKYRGRLIIPFINRNGKLFYFQGRALGDEQPKYLNCKNLKSSQVLYPFDYGSQEPLYITEGVFDCLSLQAVGLRKKFMQLAHWIRRDDLHTVVPPEPFKDWNEILIKKGPDFLKKAAEETGKLDELHLAYLAYEKGCTI